MGINGSENKGEEKLLHRADSHKVHLTICASAPLAQGCMGFIAPQTAQLLA